MGIFYVNGQRARAYDFTGVGTIGDKTIVQLRGDISRIPKFCRDETSIEVTDLIGYLNSGITLYSLNSENLNGVINFEVNGNKLNVYGLCVPGPSNGIGTQLINAVKTFAQLNRIATITLTCYDSVVDFYTRNGFRTQAERIVRNDSDSEDSDSESDSESGSSNSKHSIIYDMSYAVSFGGKRKKNRSKKHISKKHRSKKHISKKNQIKQ